MAQKFLGIHIGSTGVSVLLMESGVSKNRIEAHRFVPLGGAPEEDTSLSAALETALDGLSAAGARCSVAIPARHIHFRNLRLPAFEPQKIRSILLFELEPLLPFPVEEVVTDFTVFTDSETADHAEILTAAVSKATLSRYLRILRDGGIEPETVTFQGYAPALCQSRFTESLQDWLFVDVDGASAAVFIFRAGQPVLIRCAVMPPGDSLFEKALPEVVLQTLYAAQHLFVADYRPDIVRIRHEAPSENPNRFQLIAERIGIPVKPADFSSAAAPSQQSDTGSGGLFDYNAALALALFKSERIRGIHFLQGPFALRTRWADLKSPLARAGLLLGAVLVLAAVYLFMDLRLTEAKAARLNAYLTGLYQTTFPEEKRIVDPLSQMKAKLEALRKQPVAIPPGGNRIRSVDLLNEISTRIPMQIDVELMRLTAGPAEAVLFGNSDTFNSVNALKLQLEGSRLFKTVVITSTRLNRPGNRVDFVLTLRL